MATFTERIRAIIEGESHLDQPVNEAKGSLGDFRSSVTALSTAFLAVNELIERGAQAIEALNETITEQREITEWADRLGIGVERLDALGFVAERGGLNIDQFNTALQRMIRRVAEAAQGTGEAQGAIRDLGFDAAALAAQSPDEIFLRVADAISKVEDPGERVRLLFKFFDSEGVALAQVMSGGREEIERWIGRAGELGLVTRDMAEAAREAAAQQVELERAARGVRTEVVNKLIKAISDDDITRITDMFGSMATFAGKSTTIAVSVSEKLGDVVDFLKFVFHRKAEPILDLFGIGQGDEEAVGKVSELLRLIVKEGVDAADAVKQVWGEAAREQEDSLGRVQEASRRASASTVADAERATVAVMALKEEINRDDGVIADGPPISRPIRMVQEDAEAARTTFLEMKDVVHDTSLALEIELLRQSDDFFETMGASAKRTTGLLFDVFGQSVAHSRDWGDAMLSVVQNFVGQAIAELLKLAAVMIALNLLKPIQWLGGVLGIGDGAGAIENAAPDAIGGPEYGRTSRAGGIGPALNLNVSVNTGPFATRSEKLAAAREIGMLVQEAMR